MTDKIKTEIAELITLKSEENQIKDGDDAVEMPLLALFGKVLFPKILLNFDVGRPFSVSAVNKATELGSHIFITMQKGMFLEQPKKDEVYSVGVVAKIKQIVRVQNTNNLKVSVEALYRAKITEFTKTNGYFMVKCQKTPYVQDGDTLEIEALSRMAKQLFIEYSVPNKTIGKDMVKSITALQDTNEFIDNALSVVRFKEEDIQSLLEIDSSIQRLERFVMLFNKEKELAKIEAKIATKVRKNIDKSQKEFYLREQITAIRSELGEDGNEISELVKEIKAKALPKEIEEKALKEVSRLEKVNPSSPDYSIILNYLDWIKELPFTTSTKDTDDLKTAKQILDADHFGLEKVKQRIVEYIAVLQLTHQIKGPILCFVGPPGVGKTSVATSIARALNRKFVRMSLGGVKDEAEIRGHRKTYVGAMPGRIVYGLKNAGSNNPVFLLDEIDKLSSDIHGDPASALLEVLDPEQNTTFRDRYLEVPIDLSKVMFITTANSLDTIPYPLLDRMEIIELTGYTNEEKLQIAKQYLVPKQLKLNGLTEKKVVFTDEAIKEIVSGYTMEAGVRNLEREIGSVIRKVATKVAENKRTRRQTILEENVKDYLGVRKINKDAMLEKDEVGACTGLAWTSVGGTTLTIEVGLYKGKGEILLTGKLGDVMKESARTGLSYIRSNAKRYGIDEDVFSKTDIHLHVPEGATPKDGPSAGITIATALYSAFTGKTVKKSVAMTGEITLRGKVLAIGGLKEKALASYRQGIKTVIIPKANQKDLVEIPQEIRKEIKFITVENFDDVLKIAVNK